jgi:hypothetical protein
MYPGGKPGVGMILIFRPGEGVTPSEVLGFPGRAAKGGVVTKLDGIEGIGRRYAEGLKSAGVDTIEELLEPVVPPPAGGPSPRRAGCCPS